MANGIDRFLVSASLEGPGIARVKAALEAGATVGIPTDTVYGLAVLASMPGVVDRLFGLKGRPESVAIAVLVADVEQAMGLLEETPAVTQVATRFWPGALTLVARRSPGIAYELGGDEKTIGVRCPDAPYVRELCRRVGPLAVTSANRHREPPATSAAELRAVFGPQLLVADGGICEGQPSTVISLFDDEPRCLREGTISFETIAACIEGTRSGSS